MKELPISLSGQIVAREPAEYYRVERYPVNSALKVSVIIPVYNVEPYLRECLDSVVNQTLRGIEIICVNDGSTDNSGAVLAEYTAPDDRITVIEHNNQSI